MQEKATGSAMHSVVVRSAVLGDETEIFGLIQALAEYEKLSHAVTGTPKLLAQHLFGDRTFAEAIVAEVAPSEGECPIIVGFALCGDPIWANWIARGLCVDGAHVDSSRGRSAAVD